MGRSRRPHPGAQRRQGRAGRDRPAGHRCGQQHACRGQAVRVQPGRRLRVGVPEAVERLVTSADLTDTARVSGAFALEARGVYKRFGGTQALDDASLLLRPSTVHSLLGGNGSGKSSMLKCLAGVYRADAGEVTIHGRQIAAADISPIEAHHAGLRVVHQDLGLFDHISIEENFAFDTGFPTGVGGHIEWRALRRQVADLLEQYGIHARPRDLVGTLRPAQKTLVAIARALRDQTGSEFVLLLDEPTASLPRHESEALLAALRERAANGQTIAFVSHRLQEVRSVADEITVYRDGKVAGTLSGNAPEDDVVALIAGPGRPPAAAPARRARTAPIGATTLAVENLTASGRPWATEWPTCPRTGCATPCSRPCQCGRTHQPP